MQKVDQITELQRAAGVDNLIFVLLGLSTPKGSIGQNQKIPPAETT